jgi:hypothetical protein
VFLFQFFINDIPLGSQHLHFIDDCAILADKDSAEGFTLEAWTPLNRISFGVQKWWLLTLKRRGKPPVVFFGEDLVYRATSSSSAFERDTLDHLYPEIIESPELRLSTSSTKRPSRPAPL